MTKCTCEEARQLDITRLFRDGSLRHGAYSSWAWPTGGGTKFSIQIYGAADHMIICANPISGISEQRIFYDWTEQRLGGRRRWFLCPSCGKRCSKLFEQNTWFACRRCLGLAYQSQREQPQWRPLLRVQKICMRLGGTANLTQPFPPKPKGMHVSTYDRLRARAWVLEQIGLGRLSVSIRATRSRLEQAKERGKQ